MMLRTTLKINPGEKDLWFIIQAYMKRWSIEETIRFLKQTYDLEYYSTKRKSIWLS